MGARGQALRRLLRGLSARRWSSLALLLTGALTVGAAVLGPLYARAAQESVLHDALTAAPAQATGLHAEFTTSLGQSSSVEGIEARGPQAGVLPQYPDRVTGIRTDASIVAPGSREDAQSTRLVWRQGFCDHLIVVSGRCPTAANEAMVSQRTAEGGYGYRVGGTAILPVTPAQPVDGAVSDEPPAAEVTVVGVYRPVDPQDAYWFGRSYFNAVLSYRDNVGDTVDAVFVDRSAFPEFAVSGVVDLDFPLDADRLRLADRSTVLAGVDRVLASAPAGTAYADPLRATLAGVDADNRDVGTGSLLVSLQLAALALFVLFVATADALDGRGGDVALAKLRGLSPGATLRFLLTESVTLLVLAVPIGVVLGLGATHLLSAALLVPGVPVVFPWASALAAAGAFLGALIAAGLAGRRVLTRTVLDQWRGARRTSGGGRRVLVAELGVAAVAVAGLVLLAAGESGTFALLAPGLLVLAVALLGVRVVPWLARRAVPRTAGSRRLGRFLAVRQVARRPAALRLAVLLAVAIGLAVFAVGGETIAVGNRSARAEVETGAPRVVAVQFGVDADPVALAASADPDGRWAMVAAKWLPAGGTTVTGAVVGVDPSRLAAVAFPTTQGPSLATIAHDLDPEPVTAIVLRAGVARLTVTASALTTPAPYVDLVVQPTGQARQDVRLGTLRAGRNEYTGPVPCAEGCVLAGIGWERPVSAFDPVGGTTVVESMAAGADAGSLAPVDLGLSEPGGWRARSPDATDDATTSDVTVTPEGIRDVFSSTNGGSAGLGHGSSPSPLPLWASRGAVIRPPDQDNGQPGIPQVLDAFDNGYPVRTAGTTSALPGVKVGGVLADVSGLRDELPGFTGEAQWSVWLGADAPPDAMARLEAAGFQTGGITVEADRAERLGRQGPALALALLLACAIAAAVLAIGATATAIATTGRRRSFELAALRVLGVSRGSLTRATVLEQGILLGSALVLGVPTGVVAAVLAMPVIPQFSDASPLPLANTPVVWPIAALAGGFLVLLVATAVLAGTALVRAAVPARLRETGQ